VRKKEKGGGTEEEDSTAGNKKILFKQIQTMCGLEDLEDGRALPYKGEVGRENQQHQTDGGKLKYIARLQQAAMEKVIPSKSTRHQGKGLEGTT